MPERLDSIDFCRRLPDIGFGYLVLLGGEAAHRLVIRELCLIEPRTAKVSASASSSSLDWAANWWAASCFVRLLVCCPRVRSAGARSISALRWAIISARVPTLMRCSSASGLAQLGDQFGIVDNQKGRTRHDILTTADRDLRQPAGDARGDVDPRARRFLPARVTVRGARDTRSPNRLMATKSTPVMTARGLRRTPRRAVALASVAARSECGWRCGGRRNFGHRFVAAMMGS
jgi:hypothetical protein